MGLYWWAEELEVDRRPGKRDLSADLNIQYKSKVVPPLFFRQVSIRSKFQVDVQFRQFK